VKDIQRVGGVSAVCGEADRLFAKYGTTNLVPIYPADLLGCRALSQLGTVDGIWPDGPPVTYLKIRVGDHLDGYIVQLFFTNVESRYIDTEGFLISPRIFVHR